MTPVDLFLSIGKTLSIVHHVPGRIRLRFSSQSVPLLKQFAQIDALDGKDVAAILASIEGIKTVKINELVGSATIEYDSSLWTQIAWQNLCEGSDDIALREKIAKGMQELGVSPDMKME